jgi:Fe-S-cluster containining protein
MVLSFHDIERIEKRGFDSGFFVMEQDGWLQLKNAKGRCVFHNGIYCTIYKDRPIGCALYPIVYDADHRCAILDEDCPQRHCFSLTTAKTKQLYSLVSLLGAERGSRHKKNK